MKETEGKNEYFFTKENRNGSKDRYILAIPDPTMRYGYKRLVFHARSRSAAAAEAQKMYEQFLKEKEQKRNDIPVTVREACETFISRREEGRKDTCQEWSIIQVTARFRNHLIPFMKNRKLSDLTVEDIFAFKYWLERKGLAEKTINYSITEAREFFAYCVEVGWMERTPFDSTFKIARPKPKKQRIPGNADDYRLMLKKPWKNPVFHAVSLFCFFTGMRVSEIRALRLTDFVPYYGHEDTEDCVIVHIRHSFAKHNREKSPKNGRARITVIPRWVYEFIKPVFTFCTGEYAFTCTGTIPFSIGRNLTNFRKELAVATGRTPEEIHEAGIDFHSMRAMFNSMMTGELSSDIRRSILGWTSENVAIEHYFKVMPMHYQKILDAQKVLFSEEDIRWFRENDILALSSTYNK